MIGPALGWILGALGLGVWAAGRWQHHRRRAELAPDMRTNAPGALVASVGALAITGLSARIITAPTPVQLAAKTVPEQPILLVIDVSCSMDAEDQRPTRRRHAERALEAAIAAAPSRPLGLIAYTSEARTLVPISSDRSFLWARWRELRGDLLPLDGSSSRAALRLARAMLRGEPSSQVDVILVTDGEDHGADPRPDARALRRDGHRVHVLGVGTRRGAKVRPRATTGAKRAPVPVRSRARPKALAALAQAGGGRFVHLDDRPETTRALLELLPPSAEPTAIGAPDQTRPWPKLWLGLAALALAVGLWPEMKRLRPLQAGLIAILPLMARADRPTPALFGPAKNIPQPADDPAAAYNRGWRYAARGATDAARPAFRAALDSAQAGLRGRAHFALGNSRLKARAWDESIRHYRAALKDAPDLPGVRRNLALALHLRSLDAPADTERDGDASSRGTAPEDGTRNAEKKERAPGTPAPKNPTPDDAAATTAPPLHPPPSQRRHGRLVLEAARAAGDERIPAPRPIPARPAPGPSKNAARRAVRKAW